MTNLDSILKSRDITNKDPSSQSYGFSSSQVQIWEWTIKKSVPKNWCIRTVVLSKTLEYLDRKEIKPVNPNGNQPWIFTGRTDTEAEALILWLPDVKSWLIGKGPNARKDWGQKKVVTENKMVGWHHWLNGHESEQILGDTEGQESLTCCSLWDLKESDMT